MGHVQWKEILGAVDKEGDLSKDNVIERIEKALGSRLIKLASQLSGTHDQEHKALQKKLRSWRESGFSLNYQFDSDIGTLLHIAAGNNYVNIIMSLKNKGADINIQNERGNTPLHEAVKSGRKEAVQSLIENGADVNAKTERSEETPLHLARNAEITELLIKNGASVNKKNEHGCVPLHNAVECKVDIVGWSIKKVFSTIARDEDKNAPLHNDGHTDAVRVLLQAKGIDINAANEDGYTPLHLAVLYCCTDTVKVLLQAKGIDINAANEGGHTPLHFAASLGHTDIVKVLLQMKGIDVNATDKNGCTPLLLRLATQYTIQHGTQYIKGIVGAVGINVSITAPVLLLDKNNNKKIVDALMEKDADPLLKGNDGRAPIDFDENGCIRQFLREKALKKSVFYGGSTALLGAAIAAALFATGTVAIQLIPIVIAVVAVMVAALVVGSVTYMMSKPSTKLDGAKEEKTAGNKQGILCNPIA